MIGVGAQDGNTRSPRPLFHNHEPVDLVVGGRDLALDDLAVGGTLSGL